jgi:hypothetical protein
MRKSANFFVADLVLIETDWVLSSLYDWTRDEIANAYGRSRNNPGRKLLTNSFHTAVAIAVERTFARIAIRSST